MINIKYKKLTIDEELPLGEILRYCRVKNKIDAQDIASFLKVKKQDIVDLENGIIHKAKSSFYVSSLVRSYADLLKIDSKLIKAKLDSHHEDTSATQVHKLIDLEKSSKYTPSGRYLIYSLSLIFIVYCLLFCDFNAPKGLNGIITQL
jgi:cytoskeletal protein RodZ